MARLNSKRRTGWHTVLVYLVSATMSIFACEYLDADETQPAPDAQFVRTFYVADLVIPIGKPQFSANGERERPESTEPDFETLTKLIKTTVHPQGWESSGGTADIQEFATNLSLVISADVVLQARRLFFSVGSNFGMHHKRRHNGLRVPNIVCNA